MGSRQHLHRMRLPGRILHFVNTEIIVQDDNSSSSCCCSTKNSCACCSCCRGGYDTEDTAGGDSYFCPRSSSVMSSRLDMSGSGSPGSVGTASRLEGLMGPRRKKKRAQRQRRRVFTPVWASPNDLGEIRVTPAFLVDHNPEEILPAVQQTLEDLGIYV